MPRNGAGKITGASSPFEHCKETERERKHNQLGFCTHFSGMLQQQGGHMCYKPPAGDAPLFSFKKINRQLHTLLQSALALQVKGYHPVQMDERQTKHNNTQI